MNIYFTRVCVCIELCICTMDSNKFQLFANVWKVCAVRELVQCSVNTRKPCETDWNTFEWIIYLQNYESLLTENTMLIFKSRNKQIKIVKIRHITEVLLRLRIIPVAFHYNIRFQIWTLRIYNVIRYALWNVLDNFTDDKTLYERERKNQRKIHSVIFHTASFMIIQSFWSHETNINFSMIYEFAL